MISPGISAFLGRGFFSSLLAPLPEVLETPQEQAPFVAISDHFLQALPHLQVRGRVREAWTRPSMTSLSICKQVQGPSVHFENGEKEDFEHLILATGYRSFGELQKRA